MNVSPVLDLERIRFAAPAVPREGRIKGSFLRSHLDWIHSRSLADQRLLIETLLPDVRGEVTGVILPSAWYRFRSLVEVQSSIVELFGEGDCRVLREMGEFAAKVAFEKTYGSFAVSSCHRFFRYFALLHPQLQSLGGVTYRENGATAGIVSHRHFRWHSPLFCESSAGFYEECARQVTRKRAKVIEPECQSRGDECCTFEVLWE